MTIESAVSDTVTDCRLSTVVPDSLPDATAVGQRDRPDRLGQPRLAHVHGGQWRATGDDRGMALAATGEPPAVVMRRADEAMDAVKRARCSVPR